MSNINRVKSRSVSGVNAKLSLPNGHNVQSISKRSTTAQHTKDLILSSEYLKNLKQNKEKFTNTNWHIFTPDLINIISKGCPFNFEKGCLFIKELLCLFANSASFIGLMEKIIPSLKAVAELKTNRTKMSLARSTLTAIFSTKELQILKKKFAYSLKNQDSNLSSSLSSVDSGHVSEEDLNDENEEHEEKEKNDEKHDETEEKEDKEDNAEEENNSEQYLKKKNKKP